MKYHNWRSKIESLTPPEMRLGNDIFLLDADYIDAESAIEYEPFKIDMTIALICLGGSARIRVNMREYRLQAQTTTIILYDQIGQLVEHSHDFDCKTIAMSRDFSNALFTNIGDIHPLYSKVADTAVMNIENGGNVFGRYYSLLADLVRSPRTEFKLEAAKHLTLAMFYGYSYEQHGISEDGAGRNRRKELYTNFLELLRTNYKQHRDLTFYASALCITPKYLSQVVREVSGRSAMLCIEEYVITECKALLSSTTMTIQQIADAMNFPSQSVFGKYFKRVVGVSPKEYRN
ncbi:MAG: AraC family transcriptional regulator [Rikenellaceae bacterium]|nr:AraC family transcriptional regulator [Rikenellaceae bacterium]